MANYPSRRRTSRSRPMYNYVWQPMPFTFGKVIPSGTIGSVHSDTLTTFTPGIGDDGHFQDDHVLERVRGSMAHNGIIGVVPTEETLWFPFTLAALKIPTGFSPQDLDLFDNTQGDDFVVRMDAVCNIGRTDAIPNWHALDSKAKRKFSVGDTLSWIFSLVRPTDSSFTVDIAVNARVLWKLRL